jgi:hypothetical protein
MTDGAPSARDPIEVTVEIRVLVMIREAPFPGCVGRAADRGPGHARRQLIGYSAAALAAADRHIDRRRPRSLLVSG